MVPDCLSQAATKQQHRAQGDAGTDHTLKIWVKLIYGITDLEGPECSLSLRKTRNQTRCPPLVPRGN